MRFRDRPWVNGNPDEIEYGWLYRILENYLNPEINDFEELQGFVQSGDPLSNVFKRQLRDAMEGFNDGIEENIGSITAFDDGSGMLYLRRLWRDLYPGEPVPGGDDEFRETLRRTILQDLDELPEMLIHYIDFDLPDFRPAARALWERHFPDEPVPQS
ncbi:hypothetical protein [Microlunatus parietis]|uniref:Uncharacterized protein n=1 Tax=Microlunatus parietis TaxID=682979 RepID=A0A7Y9IFH0_9ACTN|nr:hypothetical protein [Microlunatus parietis]NYE75244.1 hypothetical protein [Microlunatus parietis]